MNAVTLDDKYSKTEGRVYLTGSQALVRLPLMQRARDVAAGLNTAGFISGYRGSPLGIYDLALWQAEKFLKASHIRFQPGVNEDLAATAVWGSQQANLIGKARYDGVFALWYGKGPGVDRSGDAIKHGNYAGSAQNGGVLVLCGDDHGARSSTVAHQSDHAMIHAGIPVLHPSTVQEYLDYGLYGIALSRYSGCWIGFKCVTDTVEGSASVVVDPMRLEIRLPDDFDMPPGGLNIRLGTLPLQNEKMLFEQRHLAAQAFVRANHLDGVRLGKRAGNRLGIVTTGKSYLDVLEALRCLDIDDERAEALGIAIYKVAMVWPLEPIRLGEFAQECEEIFVVEEKRPVIEDQIARILFNLRQRPLLVGKSDEAGAPLLSAVGELDPDRVMHAIAARYLRRHDEPRLRERMQALGAVRQWAAGYGSGQGQLMRMPSFCAGCPHNTSTRVPDGSTAMGGIGCHGMAVWLPQRNTMTLYQMGGEGAAWIGQAPFVDMPHIFQNLGDGTYFHSGLLAIRACVTANVDITYKILLNGAIAMTGGQPIEGEVFDGGMTAPRVAAQLHAEGVRRIALVSDDPDKHQRGEFPALVSFHHRDELDAVQKELRTWPGVSALIYDQACATERRRLRKRGKLAEAAERVFIHPEVCEGCGDCGVQSNCIALEPEETPLGRKRRINHSVCNKDYSCVKGLCPSFVSVSGGRLRARADTPDEREAAIAAALPEPAISILARTFSILIAGIGGNGVVTVGALLGMAAHIEGRSCTVLDISGLAQRNGAVTSHVRFAADGSSQAQSDHAARIPQGAADLVLGCDPVVASGAENLSKMAADRTAVVFNRFVAPTSTFASNPDLDFSDARLEQVVRNAADAERVFGIDATTAAIKLLGNAIGANLFLVGYAWQKGLIPLRRESIDTAIDLNGASIELNRRAFALGRIAAADSERMLAWTAPTNAPPAGAIDDLDSVIADRVARLRGYQNVAYAERYRALVQKVAEVENRIVNAEQSLSRAVASAYAKLLSYKDEYEVARLFASQDFRKYLHDNFEGDYSLRFNLAPPLLSTRDRSSGRLRKKKFGPWMLPAMGVLSRFKFLRGTLFDIFGYSGHRRLERQLIADYETLVAVLLQELTPANHAIAVALAALPEKIRGYDVVKERNVELVRAQQHDLLEQFRHAGRAAARAVEPALRQI
ncbi:indolepyruvate ferredoxin oxidoreductase family protein [Burkholderia sp. BCC1993]|uniref:indolepyruvate ferredoxin oxidoreductase family protein n=1 Tax=Burkholderia sp. BCC1993 TaxID=2817444 RepID=UPI002AB00A19|nr:indolepyruvate ferredoxin oxidoreductase family protein [Burkholderia sp. BCC1993]